MRDRRGSGATTSVPVPDLRLDTLDVTDLGERPIPDRLDVPPASIPPSRGWLRPSPVLVVIGAIALVAMAIGGPDAPGGTTSSASPGAIASGEPTATADPCPPEGLPDPTVTLARSPSWPSRARATTPDRWADPASAGFRAPIDGFAESGAGDYMVLRVTPAGCVSELRVDVQGTGLGGEGLRLAIRPTPDGRAWRLFAPPAGDWTVRVAMRLRGAAGAGGDWAVYFLRLRVDNAAFVEPFPDGHDPDGQDPGSDVAIVTPARPCQVPAPGDERPPEILLTVGETVIAGGPAGSGAPSGYPDLSGLPVTELAFGPVPTLTIAGDRCAVNWRIAAGPMPTLERPFVGELTLDEMSENGTDDPTFAAQNEFRLDSMVLGEFVLMADLDFGADRQTTVYWRLDVTGAEIPDASVRAAVDGPAVRPVIGCGANVQAGAAVGGAVLYDAIGMSATSPCWGIAGESWPVPPSESTVRLPAGDLLVIEVPGHRVTDWSLEYDARLAEPGSSRALGSGYFATPQESIGIPAPPPGEWIVRLLLTVEGAETRMWVPYYFLLDVVA